MGKRLDLRLVCLFVLAMCLGPGAAHEAVAQQGNLATSRSNRELAGKCWFGSWDKCNETAKELWDGIVGAFLGAIQNTSAEVGQAVTRPRPKGNIVRDGSWAMPNAPIYYELIGNVPEGSDAGLCRRLPEQARNREALRRLVCEASQELRPNGRNQWQEENDALQALRKRLVIAGCLAPLPQDPCATATPSIAALSDTSNTEPVDLEVGGHSAAGSDQRLSEPVIDLQ